MNSINALYPIVLPDEARDGRNVALIEFIGVLDRPKKILSTIN